MKFTAFKEFRFNSSLGAVVDYLTVDLRKFLRELQLGLTRLKLLDNFESFQTTVTLPVSVTDYQIPNELVSGLAPTQRLIVRGGDGSEQVVDGDTPWSNEFVYLKNLGSSAVTVTVIFLR